METFLVRIAYHLEGAAAVDDERWNRHIDDREVEAQNQTSADEIIQKEIDSGELDMSVSIGTGKNYNRYELRPHLSN